MSARRLFFEDQNFEFLTLIALGSVAHRMGEVGEVLATVSAIKDGDSESWFDVWMASGRRVEEIAKAAEAKGHSQTARDAFLRASMYMGTAFFNILGTSQAKEKVQVWKRHRSNAEAAFRLWPTPVEKVTIPYEDTTLEGFFFSGGEGRRPLMIVNNGSDGTVVEMLAFCLDEAVKRGYHALTFDGPGQGRALYIQDLYFRYDWEQVITPVVDWALARDDVEPERIALFGCSQAGYWAPRAAAFEHRLAALIADPGVVRVDTSWRAAFPEDLMRLYRAGDREQFDGILENMAKQDPGLAAIGAKRSEPFGTDSVFDILTDLERWDLSGVAGQIMCPTLITDPEDEQFWPGQSRQLYDLLTAPKTVMPFTATEGANWHCEPVAPVVRSHRVLDWLDETLARAPTASSRDAAE